MMQVVHDVAPGAKLAFHTAAITEADFATGIQDLAAAGAQVIADDVSYFDEPFFQDGLVAQAVNAVNAAGVAYFSAAGNSGSNGYDNTAPAFASASTAPASEMLLNFDTSGPPQTSRSRSTSRSSSRAQYIAVILQWDQPYVTGAAGSGGATSQMDLCITSSDTGLISAPAKSERSQRRHVSPTSTTSRPAPGQTASALIHTRSSSLASRQTRTLHRHRLPDRLHRDPLQRRASRSPSRSATQPAPHARVIKVAIDDNGAGVTYPGPHYALPAARCRAIRRPPARWPWARRSGTTPWRAGPRRQ